MKKHNCILFMLSLLFTYGCSNNDGSFDNKVYLSSESPLTTVLIKPNNITAEKTLQAEMPVPQNYDVLIKYAAAPSLVNTYNEAYYDNAVLLNSEFYDLSEPNDVIPTGSVRSQGTVITFNHIDQLDRETVYVLPVTIAEVNADILLSARTHYFIFKGAALINVVADLEDNALGAYTNSWNTPSALQGFTEITMEALINARDYERMISTVMGVEGRFLIRLGDAGFPSNQIQVATNRGNFPDGDSSKGLPVNTWTHIAVTCNTGTGEVIIYVNGKVQSSGKITGLGTLDMTTYSKQDFYIGRSYEDARYFNGAFSECRIWNIIRTQEEIASSVYEVDPATPGLVAYWKCDDGGGNAVKDYTANENNLTSRQSVIKWAPVSLP